MAPAKHDHSKGLKPNEKERLARTHRGTYGTLRRGALSRKPRT